MFSHSCTSFYFVQGKIYPAHFNSFFIFFLLWKKYTVYFATKFPVSMAIRKKSTNLHYGFEINFD